MNFGISHSVRSREVRPCTPGLFWQTVRSPHVAHVCAGIADAWEACKRGETTKEEFETVKNREKKRLPIFCFHATFPGGRRLNADAVPSGLSMYDIDHLPAPRQYFEHAVADRVEELGIVLAHITPSREGLRLVFGIPPGMTLEQAQGWMSQQLNDPDYDRSVKDLARSSFAVPEDYILYIDEEKLFDEQRTPTQEETTAPDGEPASPPGADRLQPPSDEDPASDEKLSFKGIPYAGIIRQWFRLSGGEPAPGERNTKLHRLAYHLRHITDNDEALLLRIMPRYGLGEDEMKALIHSACTAKWCYMPRMMREALVSEEMALKKDECRQKGEEQAACDEISMAKNILRNSETPPPLPEKLPPLVELLLSRTPDIYKPAVAHAIFPPLATHLHRVSFRYIDNVLHEATLMNVLMAGTGAGKDCISEPINRIMADIRERDAKNLERERQWKQEVSTRGANKDKRKRPEGLVIQEIDADMTNPAFVMRTAEADGHFLYTKLNEIDQFDALRGSGRGGQQFQIICLAFDPGNRYGQTRVGAQSVTEKVTIRFNWNAATTISKGKRYFARVLTDGPVSRINFCTIPEREIGADMPVYGTYDDDFDGQLRPYIERLTQATGVVECPEAYRLAQKLRDENAEFARLSQSRVFENLSFRANVIAWLKACVLFVAAGGVWDDSIEEFVRWSLRYDLWCKLEFFGAAIEKTMTQNENEGIKPGRRNLLMMLPDEFTMQDAVRVRQDEGLDAPGTAHMLSVWKARGYISMTSRFTYQKLKYRNDGINLDSRKKA